MPAYTVEQGQVVKPPRGKRGFPPPAQWAGSLTVLPPCENKTGGQWYCVTHGVALYNGFDKDSHIESGRHVLAWQCFEHGLEQP